MKETMPQQTINTIGKIILGLNAILLALLCLSLSFYGIGDPRFAFENEGRLLEETINRNHVALWVSIVLFFLYLPSFAMFYLIKSLGSYIYVSVISLLVSAWFVFLIFFLLQAHNGLCLSSLLFASILNMLMIFLTIISIKENNTVRT
jgi:hypothetical protein